MEKYADMNYQVLLSAKTSRKNEKEFAHMVILSLAQYIEYKAGLQE